MPNDGTRSPFVSWKEGFGIVIITNGENGQEVYKGILYECISGKYPSLDYLMNK